MPVQIAHCDTLVLQRADGLIGSRENISGCLVCDKGFLELSRFERMKQRSGEVFFICQDLQSLAWAFFDQRWIGSHEMRRGGNCPAMGNGEIEGEVVSFNAPAPGLRGGWRAEMLT